MHLVWYQAFAVKYVHAFPEQTNPFSQNHLNTRLSKRIRHECRYSLKIVKLKSETT